MFDITRKLYSGHPVWPGDTPFSFELTWKMSEGSSVNVGKIISTTHLGTHLDAPWHYDAEGGRLETVPLSTLVGRCKVINAKGQNALTVEFLTTQTLAERTLFFTGQPNKWEIFPSEYMYVFPEAVEFMAAKGVKLYGTDCPSVDPLESKDLPGHKAFARAGIYIIEGLALGGVEPGNYELTALPLNLIGADAAPVRAILRYRDA